MVKFILKYFSLYINKYTKRQSGGVYLLVKDVWDLWPLVVTDLLVVKKSSHLPAYQFESECQVLPTTSICAKGLWGGWGGVWNSSLATC